jgi:hypothetical protein
VSRLRSHLSAVGTAGTVGNLGTAVHSRYAAAADSVSSVGRLLPSPQTAALGIGIGRLVFGGGLLVLPVAANRALGLDTATAKRVSYLARMAAVRDIGLGVGTLQAGPTRAAVPWLVAGAAADAVDAVAIAGALRTGSARGVAAGAIAVGAIGVAAVGFSAAFGLRRR